MLILLLSLVTGLAQAGTLYWAGGTTDIPNGTPISSNCVNLCGVWDVTTRNWATDSNGTTYVAWTNGSNSVAYLSPFTNMASVTITASVDIVVNRITADLSRAGKYNSYFLITATNARTLTLAGSSPMLDVPSSDATFYLELGQNIHLAGSSGLVKSNGLGQVKIDGDCSALTGKLTMYANNAPSSYWGVGLASTANLRGITEFDCQSGALALVAGAGSNTHLNSTALVRLRGGRTGTSAATGGLTYKSVGGSVSTEVVSQVSLDGFGVINLNSGATPHGLLILSHPTAGLDRGRDGTGNALIATVDANDTIGTDIIVSNGAPLGVALPWLASNKARPARLNASTRALEIMPTTTAPNDLSTWGNSANYRVENGFAPANALTNGTLISTLGFYANTATLVLTNGTTPTDTLTIGSGLIGYEAGGQSQTITGGQITSGTNELDFITGDTTANGDLYIQSVIIGTQTVVIAGAKAVHYSGSATNTYTGTTYVNSGALSLERANQASITSGIVIRCGGSVNINSGVYNPMNYNAAVTVREGGIFSAGDSSGQIFNGLFTINNGLVYIGGYGSSNVFNNPGAGLIFDNGGTLRQTYVGAARALYLLTDVRCTATSSNQALITTVNTGLVQVLTITSGGTATHTFDVAHGVGIPSTMADMVIDMPIQQSIGFPGSLIKTNSGVLQLQRLTGPFNGSIAVNGGTLLLTGPFTTQSVQTATWSVAYATSLNVPSTSALLPGQAVVGQYVRPDTVISTVNSSTNITLSQSINNSGAGTTTMTNLTSSAAGTCNISVGPTGTLAGDSMAPGNVTVSAGGTLAPGTLTNALATFSVGGNLTLNSGALAIDVAGLASNDQVVVYGNASLSGASLTVNTLNGYRPNGGAGPWTILRTIGGTVSGSFTNLPSDYKVTVGTTNITLSAKVHGFLMLFH